MSKQPAKSNMKRGRSKKEASIGKDSKRRKVAWSSSRVKRSASKPPQGREAAPSPDSVQMPPPALPTKVEKRSKEKSKASSAPVSQHQSLPRRPPPAKLSPGSKRHTSSTPDSASARTSMSSSKSTTPLVSTKAPRTASQIRSPLMVKMTSGQGQSKTEFLVFTPTSNLGKRDWPQISFGSDGPLPRWVIEESDQPVDARELNLDLIRTHEMRTHIRRVLKDANIQSGASEYGIGSLEWKFEPGSSKLRKGLSKEQLYEYAYLCLLDALNDFNSRDMFRDAIARAKLKSIRHVEDPLPRPPPPPQFTHFGKHAGTGEWSKLPVKTQHTSKPHFGDKYQRPSAALPKKYNPVEALKMEYLTSRMMHHEKGTRRPGEISGSLDPYAHLEPKSESSDGYYKVELPVPSLYNHEISDEEKQTVSTDAGGKLDRVCEYKFLSFFVILLILCMFLCLFLYSFRIIR